MHCTCTQVHELSCQLQARYPTRSLPGFAKLTRVSRGVLFSFWPAIAEDGSAEEVSN